VWFDGVSFFLFLSLRRKDCFIYWRKSKFLKRKSLVACGDVRNIKFEILPTGNLHFFGYVHVEMSANKNYFVTVDLSKETFLTCSCVCPARSNLHNKCKHVAALLLSLYLLHNCVSSPPKWILQRQQNVQRLGLPGSIIYKKVKGGLTYQDLLAGFSFLIDRHNNKTPQLLNIPPKPKEKKRQLYYIYKSINDG
jgi:hypothetical protein